MSFITEIFSTSDNKYVFYLVMKSSRTEMARK